jgi:hypothetical protein
VSPGDKAQERPRRQILSTRFIIHHSSFIDLWPNREQHRERLRIRKTGSDAIAVAATISRDVTYAQEPISVGQQLAGLKIGQPMRYQGRRQVYNAEVEMCGIFTTRNSLKLHKMQESFSTNRNFRAITQKLYCRSVATAVKS